jgi:hypothetical protein
VRIWLYPLLYSYAGDIGIETVKPVVNIANIMIVRDYYYHVIPVKGVGSGLI